MYILHDYQHYLIAILNEEKRGMKEQDWTRIRTQHSAVKGRDLQQEMITEVLLLSAQDVLYMSEWTLRPCGSRWRRRHGIIYTYFTQIRSAMQNTSLNISPCRNS